MEKLKMKDKVETPPKPSGEAITASDAKPKPSRPEEKPKGDVKTTFENATMADVNQTIAGPSTETAGNQYAEWDETDIVFIDSDGETSTLTPDSLDSEGSAIAAFANDIKHKWYKIIPDFLDPAFGKNKATDEADMEVRRARIGNYKDIYDSSSSYMHPACPMETRRQAVFHQIGLTARGGLLHMSRFVIAPAKILFLGNGMNRIVSHLAKSYPLTRIMAVNDKLPPVSGASVPYNVNFMIARIEDDWAAFDSNWKNSYDMVIMVDLFDKYKGDIWALLNTAYRALKPAGLLEIHDRGPLAFAFGKDKAPAHRELQAALRELKPRTKFSSIVGSRAHLTMMAVGFTEVKHKVVNVPSNPHAVARGQPARLLTDEQALEVKCGELVQMNLFENKLLEKLAKRLFIDGKGCCEEQAEQWVTEMAFEMEQTSIHAYMPLYFAWGRKAWEDKKKKENTEDVEDSEAELGGPYVVVPDASGLASLSNMFP